MKININKVRIVPQEINSELEFCVFGEPDEGIKEWCKHHGFETYKSEHYTNIRIVKDISMFELFEQKPEFDYLDGFSPNLNKKLHIGHFSNLVLAKAFKSLGICKQTISIFGDTLEPQGFKDEALRLAEGYFKQFGYKPDKYFYASRMELKENILKDGTGEYEGAKIIEAGNEKIVAIKSNGYTTYFYQDVALAQKLSAPTLYLTGKEQDNHFASLKKLFPLTEHIGLGLVKISGKKMASRTGNVILIEDFINAVKDNFDNDYNLIYNVFAGYILKSNPNVDKNINLDVIENPKNSAGLYISYTMARLKSAGLKFDVRPTFYSSKLEFAYIKARYNYAPNVFFEALVEHCREINQLYIEHTIRDNEKNKKMFSERLSDLLLGCHALGLFDIEKVSKKEYA
jgi:hypothetical protein